MSLGPEDRAKVLARMGVWYKEPIRYVREVFEAEPDKWQAEVLLGLPGQERVGMAASKGPGKTAVLAWAGWWLLSTRPHTNGLALSITLDNLRDNLWKELAVWYARPKAEWLRSTFEVGAERIFAREGPKTWWLSARGFAQDADPAAQAETVAGLHARRVFVLMDEMGSYPGGVVVAAEAIFANKEVAEAKLIAAWNRTKVGGPAHRVETRDRKRWFIVAVSGDPEDPNRSPRVSLEWAQQQIDDWGRDNDFVRVNVLGLYPKVSDDRLLGPEEVQAAQQRDYPFWRLQGEASIWGLDPARSLQGDQSVLRERVGPVAFRAHRFRGLDGPALAQRVTHILSNSERTPDYLVVDEAGVGASPMDHLRILGWSDIMLPVQFGGKADDDVRYMDRSAEMHDRLAKWVRKVGSLPSDSQELAEELTTRGFKYLTRGRRSAFSVEPKDVMKVKLGRSPDESDALALTFAVERPVRRGWLARAMAQRARRPAEGEHERMWGEKR